MNNSNNNSGTWDWQGVDYGLPKNSSSDIASSTWVGVTTNKEDDSYMFEQSTPIKACGDCPYHVPYSEFGNKEPEECRVTSPRAKRRRTLQFSHEDMDSTFCMDGMSSSCLKTKEIEVPAEEVPLEASQCTHAFPEYASSSGCEGLDLSCEEWLAECLNDAEMNFSPDDMNSPGASDIEIDVSEFFNIPPDYDANVVQAPAAPTSGNIVLKKVRKSYIRTPPRLASSIAHPFAFIKPCEVRGDITLKEINQRIRPPPPPPPPSPLKPAKEDPLYPTSAFSGKPVVEKTKILTEGGRGSITIMRTKG